MRRKFTRSVLFIALFIAMTVTFGVTGGPWTASAAHLTGESATYTLDADFDDGALINVDHTPSDQLQLDDSVEAFNFIWIAVSSESTVVKIDTTTGAVLGKYRSRPSSQGAGNPSRTTVDNDGSVWVANRNDVWSGWGSVLHIGLDENNQCEDRNGNGVIDTSSGIGDVKAWTNTTGTRAVATAADECIVHYTKVNSRGTRHVSVDSNNDVWVGGLTVRNYDLVKGGRYDVVGSGTIIRSETSVGYGGYGGLIDGNGVIWSARHLLRWDTANPLTGTNGDPAGASIGPVVVAEPPRNWSGQSYFDSYGLCIDSFGNVWNTQLNGNRIIKYASDGTFIGSYPHGAPGRAQGCVVDGNNHVWTAHSLDAGQRTIGHILNDGTYIGNVVLSDASVGPTGVAVDGAGKIWATGWQSGKAYRIDPTLGALGADAVTPIGAEDLKTVHLGGGLYNYSDMTGSTLSGTADNGSWTIVHDSGIASVEWGTVSWNKSTPSNSSITVQAGSSNAVGGPFVLQPVTSGVDLTVANGQYLKVVVSFSRATTGETPILFDLSINAVPSFDCDSAVTFDTLPASYLYDPTVPGLPSYGPAGTFSFDAKLTNISSSDLIGLKSPITTLTGGNKVNGFPESPAIVGDSVTIPLIDGYSDGILSPGESADIPWEIGLAVRAPFTIFVNVDCKIRPADEE